VSEPLKPRDIEVAMFLYNNDRDLTKKLVAHNQYGIKNCDWE
jgi:hypothetical protein